jgi:hypothetical protein
MALKEPRRLLFRLLGLAGQVQAHAGMLGKQPQSCPSGARP